MAKTAKRRHDARKQYRKYTTGYWGQDFTRETMNFGRAYKEDPRTLHLQHVCRCDWCLPLYNRAAVRRLERSELSTWGDLIDLID